MFQDQMHCCDDKNMCVFLMKGEHDQYMSENDDIMLEMDDTLSWETKEFRKGYHNAIMQFQKQYNLRSKKAPTEPQQTNPIRKPPTDTPSTSCPKPDNPTKDVAEKAKSKEEAPKKAPETSQETHGKEVEKVSPPFNFENEMAKIKISVPFNELIKKGEYREQIIKMLKMGETPDTLNVQDDHPAILFGPCVEETNDTEDVPHSMSVSRSMT
jgi:hypothetical protein